MDDQIKIHHIALQCDNKEKAILFYHKTLGLKETKTFFLSESLTYSIFSLNLSVEVIVFQNDSLYIEVFIVPVENEKTCAHTCLLVDNLVEFINLCEKFESEIIKKLSLKELRNLPYNGPCSNRQKKLCMKEIIKRINE